MEDIFAKIGEIRKTGLRSALCTLTKTSGSTPRKAGAKMIVIENGKNFGTVGGGKIESQIIEKALHICNSGTPQSFKFDLEDDSDMHCGGMIEVFIDPMVPDLELIIFGAGHVGAALARLAKGFGFKISLIDMRKEIAEGVREEGFDVIMDDYVEAAKKLESGSNSYLVVTTPKHEYDESITGILGQKNFRYLGMIGSKKKVAHAIQNYKNQNILSEQQIAKIDMPIGIKFNAQSPEEIAVSILAKLIDVKNTVSL